MTTSEETKTKTQDNSSTLVTDIDTAVEGGGMQKVVHVTFIFILISEMF